jgi:hypothetical protein
MWNPNAFALTSTQYVLSTSLRNYGALRDPGYAREDLNVRKHFYMGERFQGILQVDYFNAFNRTQFEDPDGNASDSTFGQVVAQGSQAALANRQGEVSFHLTF